MVYQLNTVCIANEYSHKSQRHCINPDIYIFHSVVDSCLNDSLCVITYFFVHLDSQHIPTTPAANRNKRKMQQIYANTSLSYDLVL